MARLSYKRATIILVVALFVLTVPYWLIPAANSLFTKDMAVPGMMDDTEMPESWPAYKWKHSNSTEAAYTSTSSHCTLQVIKNDTETNATSILSLLECTGEERGVTSESYNEGETVVFETIPSDFGVVWTDRDDCYTNIVHKSHDDGSSSVSMDIRCNNW